MLGQGQAGGPTFKIMRRRRIPDNGALAPSLAYPQNRLGNYRKDYRYLTIGLSYKLPVDFGRLSYKLPVLIPTNFPWISPSFPRVFHSQPIRADCRHRTGGGCDAASYPVR